MPTNLQITQVKSLSSVKKFLLSTTVLVAAATGYGRQAVAVCVPTGGSNFECSGMNVIPLTVNANDANVTTAPGFSVITSTNGVVGLAITGDGDPSYTDKNKSTIDRTAASSPANGLSVVNGAGAGSITIQTNSIINGFGGGIYAENNANGALAIPGSTAMLLCCIPGMTSTARRALVQVQAHMLTPGHSQVRQAGKSQ